MDVIYLLISLILSSNLFLYTILKNKYKKIMTQLIEVQDFVAKIVTAQNLDGILEEKKVKIIEEVNATVAIDLEKIVIQVNAITQKLNSL